MTLQSEYASSTHTIRIAPAQDRFTLFSLLHEFAHWLRPAEAIEKQHFRDWRDAQVMLVRRFIDKESATQLAKTYSDAEKEAGGVFDCDR